MSTGSRSSKVVFTLARLLCDVASDVSDDVTRCLMTSMMTLAYRTVSARASIAAHVVSASCFKLELRFIEVCNMASCGGTVASNDVTASSRCHSDVL